MSANDIRNAPAISPVEDIEFKEAGYAHNITACEREDVVPKNVVAHHATRYTDDSLETDEVKSKRLKRVSSIHGEHSYINIHSYFS